MIEKDDNLVIIINKIKEAFGNKVFDEVDYWETSDAIGLQKNNKLIYLSTYGAPKYECFYECELLTDDDEVYLSKGVGNVHLKKLLEIMSEFFEIERVKQAP